MIHKTYVTFFRHDCHFVGYEFKVCQRMSDAPRWNSSLSMSMLVLPTTGSVWLSKYLAVNLDKMEEQGWVYGTHYGAKLWMKQ